MNLYLKKNVPPPPPHHLIYFKPFMCQASSILKYFFNYFHKIMMFYTNFFNKKTKCSIKYKLVFKKNTPHPPLDVVRVAPVVALRLVLRAVEHRHGRHEVHQLPRREELQVTAAVPAPATQTQLVWHHKLLVRQHKLLVRQHKLLVKRHKHC